METKLVVAIIHGMGDIHPDFADQFIDDVCDQISPDVSPQAIKFVPIHWGYITQPIQDQFYQRANAVADLDYKPVRKFILSALGDAAAYQKKPNQTNSTYQQIHSVVKSKLDINVPDNTPLIVVAHSLGCHIMSNYLWDKQHHPDPAASPFQNGKTLAGMFTLGCNIPLFSFAESDPQPIAFPGNVLSSTLKQNARWFNYFDKDDVLGYPIKVINEAYNKVVDEDIEVDIGGLLRSWNPFSHDVYWSDKDIINPVAKYLSTTLKILDND
ncbi:hypothetical protein KO525_13860 [Psychrosphaera sp. B3R10]|uniref:hypothetical protein n=1 Tax=unclassified Psychrosphaera TaxID=2641570 RepID=UPI001C0A3E24|nr:MULTISPECIES: hypothetical protein [unclassified Psychrosphaera]MBU2883437.1 hypothetical protein [Psychrosphaera sp. I2R16]MBU2990469.1 hypothetical protein [Psychrosphaera sp. B3R10]